MQMHGTYDAKEHFTSELEVLQNFDEKETLILGNASFDKVWEF